MPMNADAVKFGGLVGLLNYSLFSLIVTVMGLESGIAQHGLTSAQAPMTALEYYTAHAGLLLVFSAFIGTLYGIRAAVNPEAGDQDE